MSLLVRVAVNALALAVATLVLDGITLTAATDGRRAATLIVVALVFGAVNAVVRPVVAILSIPFIILTLGLLLLVINAFMLLLTSSIAGALNLGFHVDGFWTAVGGSIVISITSTVLGAVLED